jgi:hypothetical protein
MTFDDLTFSLNERTGNQQALADFANGYRASVVCGPYTYGGPDGLYELAVKFGGKIVYDTPVTDDVEGYLTPDRVTELLGQIEALSARKEAQS